MGMKAKSHRLNAGGPSERMGALKYILNLQTFAEFPKKEAQIKHILGDRLGHLVDTEENRQKIIELTNDENNFIGYSGYGKKGYAKIMEGLQYWAFTRNGIIQDAGANKPGNYRSDYEILNGRRKK